MHSCRTADCTADVIRVIMRGNEVVQRNNASAIQSVPDYAPAVFVSSGRNVTGVNQDTDASSLGIPRPENQGGISLADIDVDDLEVVLGL
jgi:hypothetical protein